ncbi:FtsX-like permease family protein [Corynebacterium sp. 335C]
MFHGIRELRSAPGRTALITVTVGLIALMVCFLSALATGLSHRSVSALEHMMPGDEAIVLADSGGATTLSSSRLDAGQAKAVGGEAVFAGRGRVADQPVMTLPDASVDRGEAAIPEALAADVSAGDRLPLGDVTVTAAGDAGDLWLDHTPVVLLNPDDAAAVAAGPPNAAIIPADREDAASAVDGVTVLTGDDRWNASASYKGEQMSLGAMTSLLYVISALVVGAFFTVWTVQRLRGVTIASALGASRRVLVADAVGQALIVLAAGITAGAGLTALAGLVLPDSMPAVIDASTTVVPGLLLAACGLAGAAISLKPVLSAEPREALAAA